mmetsp:Transcript_8445/g.14162  ORF Transcript_8445/g.14162 Transcript_8445/m.14162 type:complete len:145 (+) Transcript_8445:1113-1547(+)
MIEVYFGVGCFWHVQHEFVKAEKAFLGRSDAELTSLTGYAGGNRLGSNSNLPQLGQSVVCYHNMQGVADYGKMGHGEVVRVKIPAKMFEAFASVYLSLFDKKGDRPDRNDRGGEYRHMIGLPGGQDSKEFKVLENLIQTNKSPL